MSFYTRRGDQGQTYLLSGERVGKDDLRVKTYGALDELQSHLGLARASSASSAVADALASIQVQISTLSSELANASGTIAVAQKCIRKEDVLHLEATIDAYTSRYGLPQGFVIPGNSVDSAALHVARAVCRRCERLIVALFGQAPGRDVVLAYVNRLADLLFVLAWSLEVRAVIAWAVRETLACSGQEAKV